MDTLKGISKVLNRMGSRKMSNVKKLYSEFSQIKSISLLSLVLLSMFFLFFESPSNAATEANGSVTNNGV